MKHFREIFATTDSAVLSAGKFDFNFERALRFRPGLQDVLKFLQRIVCGANQANIMFSSLPHQPQQKTNLDIKTDIEESVDFCVT